MKREHSLKGKTLFQEVFLQGSKLQKKGIQIFIRKKDELNRGKNFSFCNDDNIKIGIAVSRKSGKAHERNGIKRRIRAICREYLHELDGHYCIIIRPGKNFIIHSYDEQKEILGSLFKKSGLMCR